MSRRGRDSYQPHYNADLPPRPPPAVADAMYQFGGNQRKPHGFSFRSRISERDLLRHVPTPHETPVFNRSSGGDRFKDVNSLTDSEEEPMDEGSDEEADRSKRRKLDNGSVETITKPKWSNPDVYTSLPPEQESAGKHIDVLKLIRKARNENALLQNTTAAQDDFISFDSLDDTTFDAPANAPLGPRADMHVTNNATPSRQTQTLGKRKRGHDDETLLGDASRGQYHANGRPLAVWLPSNSISSTPWLQTPKLGDSAIVALHKEIIDFYSWVRPRDFEQAVREDLTHRLSRELNRYRQGELKAFGSYAAGLYLPTGDMDLVYDMRGSIVTKSKLYQISSFISRAGIAAPGSVKVIAFAKVPIIKFVDATTGIKVDLSFNNDTGVVAIETFKKWQIMYPALPVLVAVIKQFLMIRGLNDNAVGGFGGFATICMVTSLIQSLPVSKHNNLGELLLEFFNLFGNLLDYRRVGIRMDPPAFINKATYMHLPDEKGDRLMIIDPNRPDNNITGGSNQVDRILDLFSRTHSILLDRLDYFDNKGPEAFVSFLEELIGGNFTAYYDQRRALHVVYQQAHPGSLIPPLPSPPVATGEVSNPFDETISVSANGEAETNKQKKNVRRLERLRRLFPQWAPKLANRTTLSVQAALKIGGWADAEAMSRACDARENELRVQESKAAKKKK